MKHKKLVEKFVEKDCVVKHEIECFFKYGNTKQVSRDLCKEYNDKYGDIGKLGIRKFNEIMASLKHETCRASGGCTYKWLMSKKAFEARKLLECPASIEKELDFRNKAEEKKKLQKKTHEAERFLKISAKLYAAMIKNNTAVKINNKNGSINYEKTRHASISNHYNFLKEKNNKNLFISLETEIENYRFSTNNLLDDTLALYTDDKDTKGSKKYLVITKDFDCFRKQSNDKVDKFKTPFCIFQHVRGYEDHMRAITTLVKQIRENIARFEKQKMLSSRYSENGWKKLVPVFKVENFDPKNFNENINEDINDDNNGDDNGDGIENIKKDSECDDNEDIGDDEDINEDDDGEIIDEILDDNLDNKNTPNNLIDPFIHNVGENNLLDDSNDIYKDSGLSDNYINIYQTPSIDIGSTDNSINIPLNVPFENNLQDVNTHVVAETKQESFIEGKPLEAKIVEAPKQMTCKKRQRKGPRCSRPLKSIGEFPILKTETRYDIELKEKQELGVKNLKELEEKNLKAPKTEKVDSFKEKPIKKITFKLVPPEK